MSILVAGGAGYIGSHMVKDLIENGEDVVVVKVGDDKLDFTAPKMQKDELVGFEIKALFDANPKLIGLNIRDFEILDSDILEEYIKENNIDIGILCVPKNGAQQLADRLVGAGVKGIWNFAPVDLNVSKDVIVENVNLTESLFTLSYLMKEDNE